MTMELQSIAKDWHEIELGELATFRTGPFGSTFHKADYVAGGIPLINPSHIIGGDIIPDETVTVRPELAKRLSAFSLHEGEIVIGRRGDMGRCAVVRQRHEGFLCGTGSMVVRPHLGINPKLLQALLSSPQIIAKIEDNSVGTTMINLNQGTLSSLKVKMPSNLHEQEAIAEALSDADALIKGLERLIAKKRLIKQGAMQELLTERRRLPGFSEEWVKKVLPELAEIRSGGTPSTTNSELWDGDIAWCTPTDITALKGNRFLSQTSRHITELGLRKSAAELLPAGTIVMTSRATIGECAIAMIPMSTNQGFKNFISRPGIDRDFLFYLLSAQKIGFIELCSGSTFLEIGTSQLRKYHVRVPSNTNEQVAIAGILNDMDAEIQALETRLEKAQQIKEGMMQNLLTGQIRLV